MPQSRVAKIVLGLFFSVSFLWSIFTPVFEAPDETTAYDYARYYARERKLPILTQRPPEEGVHHWEPLYFILLGRIAKYSAAPPSENSQYSYPAGWSRIREENPTNLYSHQASEFKFSWDKLAWSLHLMRLLSVLLATGGIWFVYKFGREIFPQPSTLPIIAMILTAFNPQYIFFSGILNVVNMVTFTASLFLWLLARFMRRNKFSWYHFAGLGAAFGVAIFSKMTALAMFPAALGAVIYRQKSIQNSIIKAIAIFLAAFLVTGGWYLVRNQLLYGEFSGAKAHVLYRFGRITNPFLEEVGLVNFIISYPKTQWITLWSGFGWITVYLPLIFPFMMLLLYAHGIASFVQEIFINKLKLNRHQRGQLVAIGLMPLLVWLGITKVIFIVEVFHGKDLLFVTGPLSLVVTVGWWSLVKRIQAGLSMGRGVKVLATGLMGILTAFWFRQAELASLVKGVGGLEEMGKVILMAVVGMVALQISWRLIFNPNLPQTLFVYKAGRESGILITAAVVLSVANILVLFLLFIPQMYKVSLWQLL